jgi:RNA recognition motif-containing protein
VYVENLAPDTTHESLAAKFAEFGPVAYVSIPKFRNTQRIKGFAFVEFQSRDTVRKVLDSFVGSSSHEDPTAAVAEIAPASLLRNGDMNAIMLFSWIFRLIRVFI